MKYLIMAMLLAVPAEAAKYEILYPDNEKKTFAIGTDPEVKKLGGWKCAFVVQESAGDPFNLVLASCDLGRYATESYVACSKDSANFGVSNRMKIFDGKKRWTIVLSCD